jgi:hypothetical protein
MDTMSMTAIRRFGFPKDWKWCSAEAIDGGTLLIGGVPTEKNGKKIWPKERNRCVITPTDIKETEAAYEVETGNCSQCFGKGETIWSSSVVNGVVEHKFRKCRSCDGFGKAKVQP